MLEAACLWAVQAHRAAGHASRLSLVTFGLQVPRHAELVSVLEEESTLLLRYALR